MKLYPSLIASDPLTIANTINLLSPHCDGFHIDIMDNHFVPNIYGSIDLIYAISQYSIKPLWIHLMVTNPVMLIKRLEFLQPSHIVSLHIESEVDTKEAIKILKAMYLNVSIAIKPKTPLDKVFSLCSHVDQILLMSVNPGFSGQSFIEKTYAKTEKLANFRKQENLPFRIGLDGGINATNIERITSLGGNDFVIGSALFQANNPVAMLQNIYRRCQNS